MTQPFNEEAELCAELLLQITPRMMRSMGMALRRQASGDGEQLNIGQLRMLDMLQHRTWALNELASKHSVTPSTMSRAVDVLVRRGWVSRETDVHDRRQLVLALTQAGRAAHDAVVAEARANLAARLLTMASDDRAQLLNGLRALQNLLDADPRPECPEAVRPDAASTEHTL